MKRRDLLRLITGMGAVAAAAPWPDGAMANDSSKPPSPSTVRPLREIAAEKGLLFGAAIPWEEVSGNLEYEKVVTGQCGILVPEVELKWRKLRPSPEAFDFSNADRLHRLATSNGMLFRGHPLVWEQALPKWFENVVNARNAEAILMQHISTVVSHYAGEMHSWDVVNEAIQLEDGLPNGLKMTPWLRYLGPDYIAMAFHAAHKADPAALLVYNDNWIEADDASSERRRRAVLNLLTQLKGNGVPVHALGIQSHLDATMNTTGPQFKRFLHAVEDLGLKLLVTELDVRDQRLPANLQRRDQMVAAKYFEYLNFMLQFQSLEAIVTWGLTDRFSWLASVHPRADGLPVRPLPYDADLAPTPAWAAIHRALESAQPRAHATRRNA